MFKICVVGNIAVGRKCLVRGFIENRYIDHYVLTIGPPVYFKTIIIDGQELRLQIWSGNETVWNTCFQGSKQKVFFKGSMGGIIVIDITRRATLDSIDKWVNVFRDEDLQNIPILLIGTKLDLEVERQVSFEETLERVHEHGLMDYIETSAMENINVEASFYSLARRILELIEDTQKKKNNTGPK